MNHNLFLSLSNRHDKLTLHGFYLNRINSTIQLSLEIKIQKNVLNHQIPYKYRVYTSMTTDIIEEAPWEKIYSTIPGIPQAFANRILDVKKGIIFV